MTIDARYETTSGTRYPRRDVQRPAGQRRTAPRRAITALARRAWAYNTGYADAWQRYARPGAGQRRR